jgi:hypothetical protein
MALESKQFNWKRYWVPRDGVLHFSDQGFIAEPTNDEFGLTASPGTVSIEEITKIPCLALLGEPGIGKTESLRGLPPPPAGTIRLRLDLSAYSSDYMLRTAIFEAPEFQGWINSEQILELVLDSLDECLVHVRTVARLLIEELSKYPRSRLRLRIAAAPLSGHTYLLPSYSDSGATGNSPHTN